MVLVGAWVSVSVSVSVMMAGEGIGINGFSRAGVMVLRALLAREATVVAVNDPVVGAEQMAAILRQDSTQGPWRGEARAERGRLVADGRAVMVFQEANVTAIPWAKAGAR
jgi:glyceraldehyde 3-phosphate dehydrogenase